MDVAKVQRFIASCWTAQEAARRFGLSRMSMHNFRKRSTDPLIAIVLPSDGRERERSVCFPRATTRQWMRRNGYDELAA